MTITTEAFAKVNLTLEVEGLRPDGYHAIRSVVLPVTLADTLRLESTAGELSSDSGFKDDLITKAARCLRRKAGVRRGVRVSVVKRIPVGGGLGGGSADAAATLVSLNELWGLGLSRRELAVVGAEVGSDVPSLVMGVPVVMTGRGELVEPLAVGEPTPELVIVSPSAPVSTVEVYRRVRGASAHGATARMAAALAAGDFAAAAANLANDLTPAATALCPEIGEALCRLLAERGVLGGSMSGSGSSVFGLVADGETAAAVAERMRKAGYRAWAVKGIGCPAKS